MNSGKPIEVTLTLAQLTLVSEIITTHEAMGDCELHGLTLRFPDYEGALSVHGDVLGVATPTTRAYVSMNAIIRKIDLAIKHCFEPGSAAA